MRELHLGCLERLLGVSGIVERFRNDKAVKRGRLLCRRTQGEREEDKRGWLIRCWVQNFPLRVGSVALGVLGLKTKSELLKRGFANHEKRRKRNERSVKHPMESEGGLGRRKMMV